MNKFQEKFERKTKQEKLNQFQALWAKIDRTIEKFVNSDISEEKKEAYRNLFEYIRALNEEKIAILETESEEVETSTWTEAE
jgi:succinate dehydrogenase flavin-adding protein (antitoxin of CptAB toxin-antitoxin module)